jgi:hypothetical protein
VANIVRVSLCHFQEHPPTVEEMETEEARRAVLEYRVAEIDSRDLERKAQIAVEEEEVKGIQAEHASIRG